MPTDIALVKAKLASEKDLSVRRKKIILILQLRLLPTFPIVSQLGCVPSLLDIVNIDN